MFERRLTLKPAPLFERLTTEFGANVDCEVVAPALLAS